MNGNYNKKDIFYEEQRLPRVFNYYFFLKKEGVIIKYITRSTSFFLRKGLLLLLKLFFKLVDCLSLQNTYYP